MRTTLKISREQYQALFVEQGWDPIWDWGPLSRSQFILESLRREFGIADYRYQYDLSLIEFDFDHEQQATWFALKYL